MHESDRAAEFVGFVRAHRRDLMRTAVLLCAGDEGFAEDVVQTTLTRMYLSWPRVRRSDIPLAYARKALTHVFIDEYRRAHRNAIALHHAAVRPPRHQQVCRCGGG